MTKRVLIMPLALADLDQHFEFIAGDHLDAALRFDDAMHAAFRRLAEYPVIGSLCGFARHPDIRRWLPNGFENYLIFYRESTDRIVIVRVLHGAQDIWNLFNG